ncbi:FecR family protein [Pedobacter sp. MC2016-24]|uniref:FecR family protein n=1 Tax=Pedobacter sp. MC2016-24 TaxID=2780090 RepID=UPI0018818862|nr:FecR domain-containing protein [Pedobacter sp. MC2016-24]MBE9602223.1 FecR domain-containing protein [Pedobacter sp. MC2016-24]
MINDKEWLELIGRISSGVASDEELSRYNKWCNAWQNEDLPVTDFAGIESRMLTNINQKITSPRVVRLRYYKVASIAAVMAVVFGFWYYSSKVLLNLNAEIVYKNDVLPGTNTATLTLSNGKTIQLSDAKNGVVIDATSLKYNDGSVVDSVGIKPNQMLTTTTPRGGTYQIVLPDGSHVWMNADSKMIFPAKFSGQTREVLLEGEAYFEVAKDKAHPFIVKNHTQRIEVLGTHFNLNSYADEIGIKTTLLEGSVKVSLSSGKEVLLKPGEEALNATGDIRVEKADTEEAVAWKNGNIVFRAKTLRDIMRQLSRWYDVTIVYAPDAPVNETFSAAVSRTRNISSVLERMQATGSVKFKIDGKKITVTK